MLNKIQVGTAAVYAGVVVSTVAVAGTGARDEALGDGGWRRRGWKGGKKDARDSRPGCARSVRRKSTRRAVVGKAYSEQHQLVSVQHGVFDAADDAHLAKN